MVIAAVSGAHVSASGLSAFTSAAIDTTSSTFLVACVSDYPSSGAHLVTDSKSNTWTALSSYTLSITRCTLYYAVNPTVGSGHTFSVGGTTPAASLFVQGFSGVLLASPFDTGKDSGNTATATSIQPGSLTPSVSDAVVIAGLALRDASTISINSSFTITDQVLYDAADHIGGALAYIVQTTPTAVNPTWSWTSLRDSCTALAVFKPVVISSSIFTPRRMLSGMGA